MPGATVRFRHGALIYPSFRSRSAGLRRPLAIKRIMQMDMSDGCEPLSAMQEAFDGDDRQNGPDQHGLSEVRQYRPPEDGDGQVGEQ